jgi:hypothetical protein
VERRPFFDANRQRFKRTGFWSSWMNSHVGLSALGFSAESWTDLRCVGCNQAIRGHALPEYVSSDHDPLYRFH